MKEYDLVEDRYNKDNQATIEIKRRYKNLINMADYILYNLKKEQPKKAVFSYQDRHGRRLIEVHVFEPDVSKLRGQVYKPENGIQTVFTGKPAESDIVIQALKDNFHNVFNGEKTSIYFN